VERRGVFLYELLIKSCCRHSLAATFMFYTLYELIRESLRDRHVLVVLCCFCSSSPPVTTSLSSLFYARYGCYF